jgi:hydroxymethylpyrimidine pyrophosphatase-like HAD family hydrolase
MRYLAFATDYDGTLAEHGCVDDRTLQALERLAASGRKLVLVTGRELEELLEVFPQVELFDRVVVENGAVLYRPASRKVRCLGDPPPGPFLDALREQGVQPLAVGRVIVGTEEPNEAAVLKAIREQGLELQVIFNKGAVMVLPPGVNKATGLQVALSELELSTHNTVGVGDAENDHAFLALCECSVAVANALPLVKERCDLVTDGAASAGVAELIDRLIDNDLADLNDRLTRHHILLGYRADDRVERISPYGTTVLVAGTSGAGKSTLAGGLLERLAEADYQFCIIDPEGDYDGFPGTLTLGDADNPPTVTAIINALDDRNTNVEANLIGHDRHDRPRFFEALLAGVQELRTRTGRPHWLLIDEAHHLLPAARDCALAINPAELGGVMLVTAHLEHVAPSVLDGVDVALAIGEAPAETLATFARALGQQDLRVPDTSPASGYALVWNRRNPDPPFTLRVVPHRAERRRHRRKYAEGDLGAERSFYFRGPQGKLRLRAANLMTFVELADGVDDETWEFHLHRGDYERWLREIVKDEELAAEMAEIAKAGLAPADSRARIRAAVKERYTIPA